MTTFAVRQATQEDIKILYELYERLGKDDNGYFEACFEKNCIILIASQEINNQVEDVGFGVLNFEPKYKLYKTLDIPEVQDLNVLADMRRQGVGSMLLEAFEYIAMDRGCEEIGISVGLSREYGPAQRLYVHMGYIPDGYGIAYDREHVEPDKHYPVNDDLCLMMIKELS